MHSYTPVFIILGLLLINGFFVAAEFALLGVPRATVEAKARDGNRVAILIRDILADTRKQDQYIATAQLGITLASLGLGGYGEHILSHWIESILDGIGGGMAAAHGISIAISIGLLTYFHIVIGEMIPKSLALEQPWKVASRITPLMQGIRRLVLPLVIFLNAIGNIILRMMGVDRRKGDVHGYHSAEELQYIVQESEEGGQLTPEAGRLLQEVFDFDELLAREVLVPRVKLAGIPLGATSKDLARLFRERPHTRYPVYRESIDKIVGMMHIRDIFGRIQDGKPVVEADIRSVPFVPESASLNQVLDAMRRDKTQLCVILDEFGGTEGIITLSDLFKEVVGKIPEGGLQVGEIIEDEEGRMLAAGTVRLEELGQRLNLSLEHEEVDTVSGLVLALLGRPPHLGDTIEFHGLRFRVTSTDGRGVRWCLVAKIL
ncbi:MAG: hemolysin family protein [Fibrobacterota bacterium]|nr:hemolysin family protein [Fibrobacterota bacterium]